MVFDKVCKTTKLFSFLSFQFNFSEKKQAIIYPLLVWLSHLLDLS